MIKYLLVNENGLCTGYSNKLIDGSIPYDFSTSSINLKEFEQNPLLYSVINEKLVYDYNKATMFDSILIENKKNEFRVTRRLLLEAFDRFESKYLFITQFPTYTNNYPIFSNITAQMVRQVYDWRDILLNLTNFITLDTDLDLFFNNTPPEVLYFL